jgi:hypothetical protein
MYSNCVASSQGNHLDYAIGLCRFVAIDRSRSVTVIGFGSNGMHFDEVLNNQRPVDRSVLDLLEQKPCMLVINNPVSFTEVKRAINKLKKGRAPGLNGIPPEALKAMDNVSQ